MTSFEQTNLDSISSPCPHFGDCGGCRIQDLPYDHQVERKQRDLRKLFGPITKMKILDSLFVKPSPAIWHYRNRMEFSFSSKDGKPALGLHRRGKYWDLIDVKECHICPPSFSHILEETRRFACESGLDGYDKTTHSGFWRYLLVRGTHTSGQVLAEIMTSAEEAAAVQGLAEHLRETCPELKGLLWSLVSGVSDVSNAERTECVFGDPILTESVFDLQVPFETRTFLQPNLAMAEILYGDLLEKAGAYAEGRVLDLYCGIGTIGAAAARKAERVVGVEKDFNNVKMANEMIRRNRIENMRIEPIDVADLRDRSEELQNADLVIVDPPRAGLNKKIMRFLYDIAPRRIAYVSCNPQSLKDNVQRFHRGSPYRVSSMTAYDMFPHTLHVETLCILDPVG